MKKKIILIVLILLVVGGGLLFFLNKKDEKVKDNIKFSEEYKNVGEDNVFVYKDIDEIIKIMKNGTGVVYLGFPECPWCQAYVQYLNETAKEVGIDKIYYYNISEDRKNNTKKYQEIVSLLSGKLQYDDEGNERIYVPNVSFHIEGKLIGNDYESSKDTKGLSDPKEYWTEEEIKDLKETLAVSMIEIVAYQNSCTECEG